METRDTTIAIKGYMTVCTSFTVTGSVFWIFRSAFTKHMHRYVPNKSIYVTCTLKSKFQDSAVLKCHQSPMHQRRHLVSDSADRLSSLVES